MEGAREDLIRFVSADNDNVCVNLEIKGRMAPRHVKYGKNLLRPMDYI